MLATGRMGRLTSAQKTHRGGANHMLLQLLEARCWIVTMCICGIRRINSFFLVGTQKEYTGIHLWILNHGLFIKILSSVHVEALILYAPLTCWLKCCFVVDQVLRLWLPHIERLPHDGPWFLCRILSRWLISEQRVGCYSPNFMA